MADEYDKTRCFGKPEGLGKRLAMWANSLGRNKDYPWIGLGIVDDLREAARQQGVDPDKDYPREIFTHRAAPVPPVIDDEMWAPPAKVEFDL